jgi:pimeloyl-ACP methyl ester carboxylesterase
VQFGPDFLGDPQRSDERQAWFERIAVTSRAGAARSAGGVIARPDFAAQLSQVRVPTLVVVGEADRATPLAEARRMQRGIAGSELVVVPRAGHAVAIEQSAAVSQALAQFLERRLARDQETATQAEPLCGLDSQERAH